MAALRGSEHIIHAGDVGTPEILDELRAIAPLTVVRGNIDKGAWARLLPQAEVVELGGASIYVLHDLGQLDLKPEGAAIAAVIMATAMSPVWRRVRECSISIRGAPVRSDLSCLSRREG